MLVQNLTINEAGLTGLLLGLTGSRFNSLLKGWGFFCFKARRVTLVLRLILWNFRHGLNKQFKDSKLCFIQRHSGAAILCDVTDVYLTSYVLCCPLWKCSSHLRSINLADVQIVPVIFTRYKILNSNDILVNKGDAPGSVSLQPAPVYPPCAAPCQNKCTDLCPDYCCVSSPSKIQNENIVIQPSKPSPILPSFPDMVTSPQLQLSENCPGMCTEFCQPDCPVHCCKSTLGASSLVHTTHVYCPKLCSTYCASSCPKACCSQLQAPDSHALSYTIELPCPRSCLNVCHSKCPPNCCKKNHGSDGYHSHYSSLNVRSRFPCPKYCTFHCTAECPRMCCRKLHNEQKSKVEKSVAHSNSKYLYTDFSFLSDSSLLSLVLHVIGLSIKRFVYSANQHPKSTIKKPMYLCAPREFLQKCVCHVW